MYEELIEPHAALVKFVALKFKPRRDDLEDFIQVGYIGLLKSAQSFRGGVKFSTYAYKAIYWEISNYAKKQKKMLGHTDFYKLIHFTNAKIDGKIIDYLTPEEIELVNGIYIRSESVKTVALKLNKSKSTVYRMYNNIIKKLKNDSN